MALTPRRLFTAILFIALFVMATREIADPDFWWHLRTGQFIFETGAVPHADIYSFTNAGQPWVAHEWLSELFIYVLFRLGSFPALILAFSLIIALAFGMVFARSEGKPYVAAATVLLAAVASAPTWGVRPQMLTLLLMSLYVFILEQHCKQVEAPATGSNSGPCSRPGPLSIWILVPLMILWVNLHSGYALGLVLIGIYLVGSVIEHASTLPAQLADLRSPLWRLVLVLLLCVAVVPLNPNGVTMYLYPFETLGSGAMQAYIQEWFSPDFHLVEWQAFAWLILGTLAAIGFSRKRVNATGILLLVFFAYAGLRSARNIPFFALVAAPILAEQVWNILTVHGWSALLRPAARVSRPMALLNWVFLSVVLAAALLRVGMVIGNQGATERAKLPAAAVDFLQAQTQSGPLYNAYGWGGYLIWRLYPNRRVFIDGRADVYGDKFMEEFLGAYRGSDWPGLFERYNIQTVLVEPDAPLADKLALEPAWKRVYFDKQAVVFQKQ